MIHELEYYDNAVFVTLTYDDLELPFDGSLSKQDCQDFYKRLRARIAPRQLKHFTAGEYGEQEGRPHYHAIIYGMQLCTNCKSCNHKARRTGKEPQPGTDCYHLNNAWKKGYVHIGDVTPGSTKYVAEYLQKNHGAENYGGRQRAFNLMSKGIGKRWIEEHAGECEKDFTTMGFSGKDVNLPRYYQKKLKDFNEDSIFDYSCLMHSIQARRAILNKDTTYQDKNPAKDWGYQWRNTLKQADRIRRSKQRIKESQ